jgi:LysM repeat protein
LELVKKNLQILRKKSEAVNQVTFDEDYNVPDSKPDISRMIQKKGEIKIEEVLVNDGKVSVSGSLQFRLLYVADTPGREICSLEGRLSIAETLHLNGVTAGDKVCMKWEIEDLTLHVINSRKLNIKAIAGFEAYVDEFAQVAMPVDVKEQPELSAKKRNIRVLTLGVHKKDTMRKKEEIILASNKPNIHEILWSEIEIRGMDIRADEDKIVVKGELFVFALYSGDDDANPLQWLEQAIPFSTEVGCSGCRMDMIPSVDAAIVQTSLEIKPDVDGEERVLQADVVLELDMKIYQEETVTILMDVYTPAKECLPQREKEVLEQLLVKNYSKCRVSDRIPVKEAQGKILQICHSDGLIKVDEVRVIENGIQVDGVVQTRILYSISDDEMPFYSMETAVPFTHKIEAKGINSECVYHLQAQLEQLSTMMLDSSEIEVKAVMNLNALVLRQWEEELITDISEKELDPEKLEQMPGIVCYITQPQDTLWDIAKRFYTTADSISQLNDIGEEGVKPSQSLLIVKKTGV